MNNLKYVKSPKILWHINNNNNVIVAAFFVAPVIIAFMPLALCWVKRYILVLLEKAMIVAEYQKRIRVVHSRFLPHDATHIPHPIHLSYCTLPHGKPVQKGCGLTQYAGTSVMLSHWLTGVLVGALIVTDVTALVDTRGCEANVICSGDKQTFTTNKMIMVEHIFCFLVKYSVRSINSSSVQAIVGALMMYNRGLSINQNGFVRRAIEEMSRGIGERLQGWVGLRLTATQKRLPPS